MFNILFLCTGNSARSIMAEALANHLGAGRVRAYSVGSFPSGKVNPFARELLEAEGLWTGGLASKSWDAFAGDDAPHMSVIITVCDQAAGEACPVWPGHPATGHWGIPDPAAAQGSDGDKRAAFRLAFQRLRWRIEQLLALPLESLAVPEIAAHLAQIQRAANGAI